MHQFRDVDMIVVTDMDPERLKGLIVSSNSLFYLRPAINPLDTYKVLWYTISFHRQCKVDILIPKIFSLPKIPTNKILNVDPVNDIPVIAFLVLLLLKLKAWADHGVDARQRMRDKVVMDAGDINELVQMGAHKYHAHLDEEKWLSKSFVEDSKKRVQMYIIAWPTSARFWREMGF
ncbi:hypothetical protein H0H87_008444 [Tephrocybe sp. NHM501043]|nr:hypothetical protein H0H87_008444 [Tephrocybe sp. NHM501043]